MRTSIVVCVVIALAASGLVAMSEVDEARVPSNRATDSVPSQWGQCFASIRPEAVWLDGDFDLRPGRDFVFLDGERLLFCSGLGDAIGAIRLPTEISPSAEVGLDLVLRWPGRLLDSVVAVVNDVGVSSIALVDPDGPHEKVARYTNATVVWKAFCYQDVDRDQRPEILVTVDSANDRGLPEVLLARNLPPRGTMAVSLVEGKVVREYDVGIRPCPQPPFADLDDDGQRSIVLAGLANGDAKIGLGGGAIPSPTTALLPTVVVYDPEGTTQAQRSFLDPGVYSHLSGDFLPSLEGLELIQLMSETGASLSSARARPVDGRLDILGSSVQEPGASRWTSAIVAPDAWKGADVLVVGSDAPSVSVYAWDEDTNAILVGSTGPGVGPSEARGAYVDARGDLFVALGSPKDKKVSLARVRDGAFEYKVSFADESPASKATGCPTTSSSFVDVDGNGIPELVRVDERGLWVEDLGDWIQAQPQPTIDVIPTTGALIFMGWLLSFLRDLSVTAIGGVIAAALAGWWAASKFRGRRPRDPPARALL